MAVGGLQNKAIFSSHISEKVTYDVEDVISEFRIVKRYYSCNQET